MSLLDQEIGNRLRGARKSFGCRSAREFAIKHGIPESTYSQHETGKRSLSPDTLMRYCKWLDIDPGWLLSGSEDGLKFIRRVSSVAEVSLNASNRNIGKVNSISLLNGGDNPLTFDIELFKDSLQTGIKRLLGIDVSEIKLNELVKYCLQNCNNVSRMISQESIRKGDPPPE